ncbi:hypothetical protein ACJX0J_037877 [Zea mays]
MNITHGQKTSTNYAREGRREITFTIRMKSSCDNPFDDTKKFLLQHKHPCIGGDKCENGLQHALNHHPENTITCLLNDTDPSQEHAERRETLMLRTNVKQIAYLIIIEEIYILLHFYYIFNRKTMIKERKIKTKKTNAHTHIMMMQHVMMMQPMQIFQDI